MSFVTTLPITRCRSALRLAGLIKSFWGEGGALEMGDEETENELFMVVLLFADCARCLLLGLCRSPIL